MCFFVFSNQKALGYVIIKVRPRIYFFKAAGAAGVEFRVKTALSKCFKPAVKLKMLLPTVKDTALFPRLIYNLSYSPVTARKGSFKYAYIVIMIRKADVLGFKARCKNVLPALYLLTGYLRFKFKRRERLGNKSSTGNGNA